MKNILLAIALLTTFIGCSGEAPNVSDVESATNRATPDAPVGDVMENIEMNLWPENTVPQPGERPILWIRAERFEGDLGSGGALSFEGAEAIAPAQEEGQVDLRFVAARGQFQEGKRATLEGGVTAHLDGMTIHMEAITWEIPEGENSGVAYSKQPVRIESPTQQLTASSMTLDPATAAITLTDVDGEIRFGGIEE
jgi:hypothetical protein